MGVKRLVLFNAHGGQIGLLQVAARQLRLRCPSMAVLPCFIWSGVDGLQSLLPPAELAHGLHAGQAETSLMLHLAPELVGPSRPVDGAHGPGSTHAPPDGWSLEGAAPCAWLTSDLSETGVIGDARLASIELGSQLEQALISHWTQRFKSLLCSDWPPTKSVVDWPRKS
jgi:creatinine amidohydrolase